MHGTGKVVATLACVAGVVIGTCESSAVAASYHSPGYKGTTSFRKVTTKPLPAISLGTGKDPDLLVDASGTAHVVFAHDGASTSADTLGFCNLQRGRKTCASSGVAPNPTPPDPSTGGIFSGNFPAGNHDTDGPVPLAIGNQLYLVDRRYPDFFNTPGGGTSDSNVFEWSSVDGGATPTGPGQLGDNQMAGGAVAFGDPAAPSIATISRTQTEGTFFQATAAGKYTTAKAQLGSSAQAYDGSLAVDGTRPVAAFDDTSGHIYVREFSGAGDPNDAANWSTATYSGYSPRIIGGPTGVFVLSSGSDINGGHLSLRRIIAGQPSGAAVSLGTSLSEPAISEDATGDISFAYTDAHGIEVRTSTDGRTFGSAQLAAAANSGSIGHLVTASTTDGGGFVSYVADPSGAEGVGQVLVSAFGTQEATRKPGLGPLPGGGIGSAAGDQLATSTCTTAGFGIVQVVNVLGSCWAHDPSNPNLDVSLGEVDINGVRLIPDAGVRIGIDPKLHTIDTSGSVRLVLSTSGVNLTLFHGEIHAKIPNPVAGADLFDLQNIPAPDIEGFPVDGDIGFKLKKGGVEVPISLRMPSYFGGITGTASLEATYPASLDLGSLEFKIGDLDIAALELKDVDVTYTTSSDEWSGAAELLVPAGGSALDSKVSVKFKNGDFAGGSLDTNLPYPGLPLDDTDPPPQLYLSHGGLGFDLHPATLTGTVGFGLTPLLPPGKGGLRDYAFSLDGSLSASFGSPVTITAAITGGYLFTMKIGSAQLVYKIPDQVTLNGSTDFDLGLIRFTGNLAAAIDPKDNLYAGQIATAAYIKSPSSLFSDVKIPSFSVALNQSGFAAYVPPPGVTLPFPPFTFFGTVAYTWGQDGGPQIFPYQDMTGRFRTAIPSAAVRGAGALPRASAATAGTAFAVPKHAPTASLVVAGSGGAPSVALIAPSGQQIATSGDTVSGMRASSVPDASSNATYVGIQHPQAGRWQVVSAAGSTVGIASVSASIGEAPPKVSAELSGRGTRRTLRYQATLPDGVQIRFAERTKRLLHFVGSARHASGVIHFAPAAQPIGERRLVAEITDNGLPTSTVSLGSFRVSRPPKPTRAKRLKVTAGRRRFTFTYRPPGNADHVLITIATSDGRHLQRVLKASVRRGSVPVLGFRDRATISVVGVAGDGRRGPATRATAKRRT